VISSSSSIIVSRRLSDWYGIVSSSSNYLQDDQSLVHISSSPEIIGENIAVDKKKEKVKDKDKGKKEISDNVVSQQNQLSKSIIDGVYLSQSLTYSDNSSSLGANAFQQLLSFKGISLFDVLSKLPKGFYIFYLINI
jgi:hypothetical protein